MGMIQSAIGVAVSGAVGLAHGVRGILSSSTNSGSKTRQDDETFLFQSIPWNNIEDERLDARQNRRRFTTTSHFRWRVETISKALTLRLRAAGLFDELSLQLYDECTRLANGLDTSSSLGALGPRGDDYYYILLKTHNNLIAQDAPLSGPVISMGAFFRPLRVLALCLTDAEERNLVDVKSFTRFLASLSNDALQV